MFYGSARKPSTGRIWDTKNVRRIDAEDRESTHRQDAEATVYSMPDGMFLWIRLPEEGSQESAGTTARTLMWRSAKSIQ
jgi:hypothetical protein